LQDTADTCGGICATHTETRSATWGTLAGLRRGGGAARSAARRAPRADGSSDLGRSAQMNETHYTPSRFVWHDLVTTDLAAAERFYGELVGWEFRDASHETAQPYRIMTKNGHEIGGLMLRPGPHIPPHFMGYVSVLDVDGTIDLVRQHGGAMLAGPMELSPGRLAVMQDPYGAVFALWKARKGDPAEVLAPALGSFCWDQLNTCDADGAATFYAKIFGWARAPFERKDGLSTWMRGNRQAASLMQAAQGTFAHWLSYIVIEALDTARERVKRLGGQVLVERVEVPGVGAFAVVVDNLGAMLALFQAAPRP
jgi:predicted enzyme related to lactoylglutathione lyase